MAQVVFMFFQGIYKSDSDSSVVSLSFVCSEMEGIGEVEISGLGSFGSCDSFDSIADIGFSGTCCSCGSGVSDFLSLLRSVGEENAEVVEVEVDAAVGMGVELEVEVEVEVVEEFVARGEGEVEVGLGLGIN